MRIRAMDEDTQAYDETLESIKGDIYETKKRNCYKFN